MGATPRTNRSAKGGTRSSPHYGGEGVLIHPPHQGVCGRHGTEDLSVTPGGLSGSSGGTEGSDPISASEMGSGVLGVVGRPNSTRSAVKATRPEAWRQSVSGKAAGEDGWGETGSEMSKAGEVESSISERPGHHRPRRLADWTNPTVAKKAHSLIDKDSDDPFYRHSENCVFVKAGCGKTARPVVCPEKAGMFSREQTCRGRSQSPVVWIAEERETEPSKPIDKASLGEVTSHRAVTRVNALWPRKCVSPRAEPPTQGRRQNGQPNTDRYGWSPRRGGSDS